MITFQNLIFLYSFRVAAIDHGLFSFTDVKHASWPVILVTNPKHALFAMKHHEPLHLVQESTHIRSATPLFICCKLVFTECG